MHGKTPKKKNIILFYNLSFSETARLIYFIFYVLFTLLAYITSAVVREALNVNISSVDQMMFYMLTGSRPLLGYRFYFVVLWIVGRAHGLS